MKWKHKTINNNGITKGLLHKLYIKQRLSTPKIAEVIKEDKFVVYGLLKKFKIPTRSISESRMKYPKTKFSANDFEYGYMMGLRVGDIYARQHSRQVMIMTQTTHPSMVNLVFEVFGKYGHASTTPVIIFNQRFGWHVRCFLDKSFSFLLNKPKNIPEDIIGNYVKFIGFLSGYFDSEGCIVFSHCKNYLKFRLEILSTDFGILEDIYNKLIEFDYNPTLIKINRDIYKNGAMLLRLSRRSEVLKILKELKLCHSEKIRKRDLVFRFKGCNRFSLIEEEIKKLRSEIKSEVNNFVKVAETAYKGGNR